MRTGVVLPTFRDRPDEAFAVATAAVAAGVDGVFCYDHIWPIGQPERPALAPFPVLGALATARPAVGPGRGALPGHAGGPDRAGPQRGARRAVHGAGGTGPRAGDRRARYGRPLSEEENRAYGIPFAPAAERRADMVELGRQLAGAGLAVWVAGGPARADGGGPGRRGGAQPSGTPSRRWWPSARRDPTPWR